MGVNPFSSNQQLPVGTAILGGTTHYPAAGSSVTGNLASNTYTFVSYCAGNTHVFECKHEKHCKCGRTQRGE